MAIPMYIMIAMNFPISIASASLIALIYMTLAKAGLPDDQYLLMRSLFDWLVITSLGYVQWFILLPMIWRKFKALTAK